MSAPVPTSRRGELAALVHLAWPVVLGQLGLMAMGVVDTAMVGHLGDEALGATALGVTWSFGTSIVALGTASGLDPLLSQAFGAGDRVAAGRALLRGVTLMVALAVPVTVLHVVAEAGLGALGEPSELLADAGRYSVMMTWGIVPLLVFQVVRQFLQAAGRMREGAIVVVIANFANVAFNLAFVYGWFGAPALGVSGSALATVLSRWLMVALLAFAGRDLVRDCWPGWRAAFDAGAIGRVLALGLPVGAQVAAEVWAFTGTTLVMGWFGKTAMDGHMIALNLASVSFMVPYGISAAAATRVGNLLGAGEPWQRAGWTAVGLGLAVMVVSASGFVLFPALLARVYTDEPAVIAVAIRLLPIAACFQLFDGIQAVSFGVLRGAGDTRVPGLANLFGYWCFGLPIGIWLAFRAGFGPEGLWIGLTIGLMSVASLLLWRLRVTGRRGGTRV
jgi:MATE family multidrug resistance protein